MNSFLESNKDVFSNFASSFDNLSIEYDEDVNLSISDEDRLNSLVSTANFINQNMTNLLKELNKNPQNSTSTSSELQSIVNQICSK